MSTDGEESSAGSAAEAIGPYLRVGDQVDSIDGHEISSKADFMRLAAGEKGMSRRLQVSRVRGRGGAGEGGVICAGGSDRRLIFMMSIILGMPGCHTIYGNSSSVLGGTMDVVAFPKTPESEEEGPENRETQAEGTGPVVTHALRALPPTPTTNSEEPSDAPQKQNTVLICERVSGCLPSSVSRPELTAIVTGYPQRMGARVMFVARS